MYYLLVLAIYAISIAIWELPRFIEGDIYPKRSD
jgi:hypothetical protein